MIVRDGEAGIDVYMLRRASTTPVIPDAYVFPGGILNDMDKSPQARMRLVGDWRPAEPAFTYCAMRETFEECGILFADEHIAPDTLRAARLRLLAKERTFSETLIDLKVKLDARAIRYFSRWITPAVNPHRFDARFFVARVPLGQTAEPDSMEVYDGRWIRPADALAMGEREELQMVFPTIKHLERIMLFKTVDALLQFADVKKTIPVTPDVREGPTYVIPPQLEESW